MAERKSNYSLNIKKMNKFVYIPINANSKIAKNSWKHVKKTNESAFSVGDNRAIITGQISDIIVVDIDVKDNGVETWFELTQKHGDPQTLIQRSPNGGYHYFFKYTKFIKTSVKINDIGIDIRADGGYIVCEPSKINNKRYKFMNDNEIKELPEWLLSWILLDSKYKEKINTVKTPKKNTVINDNIYHLDDLAIIKCLDGLPDKYCNDYKLWLPITTALKSVDAEKLWNNWSSTSEKYDAVENKEIYHFCNPILDINYLINVYNIENPDDVIPLVKPTLRYKPITESEIFCKTIKLDEEALDKGKYLAIDNCELFLNNSKTLIIKSDTGTGKTTWSAQYIKQLSSQKKKILSIVSRRSLVEQHIKSFYDIGMCLTSYEDKKINWKKDNICIQIDSISKFVDEINETSDYIVYLDEINSLIGYMINSSTLDNKRLTVYMQLKKILSSAFRVICCDADISDLVFKYFRTTREIESTTYVINPYKNYSGIKSIIYNNQNDIINNMVEAIKKNKYFLACFDSLTHLKDIWTKRKRYIWNYIKRR